MREFTILIVGASVVLCVLSVSVAWVKVEKDNNKTYIEWKKMENSKQD